MNQIPWQQIIDRYYPAGSPLRDIYLRHCTSVTDEALRIAREKDLPLNPEDIRAAAMLHDIGIFLTSAVDIGCDGDEPYIMHGVLGAELLRKEGVSLGSPFESSSSQPVGHNPLEDKQPFHRSCISDILHIRYLHCDS